MLAFPAAVRIFVAVQPVDMRKQFNGLWSAVAEQLAEDPKSGAVPWNSPRVAIPQWRAIGSPRKSPPPPKAACVSTIAQKPGAPTVFIAARRWCRGPGRRSNDESRPSTIPPCFLTSVSGQAKRVHSFVSGYCFPNDTAQCSTPSSPSRAGLIC